MKPRLPNDNSAVRTPQLPRPAAVLRFLAVAVVAGVVASGVAWFLMHINISDFLPSAPLCPFRAITGVPCPGCGMTRAMLALGQMRMTEALRLNAASLPLLLIVAMYAARGELPWARRERAVRAVAVAVLALWSIRVLA